MKDAELIINLWCLSLFFIIIISGIKLAQQSKVYGINERRKSYNVVIGIAASAQLGNLSFLSDRHF